MVNSVTIKTISSGENLIRYLLSDPVTAELEQESSAGQASPNDTDRGLWNPGFNNETEKAGEHAGPNRY